MKRTWRKNRKLARWFLRLYTRVAIISLGVFAVVGFFHPGFFSYGLRHLTIVFADDLNVNALVLPPPEAPTLATTLSCNPLNLAMSLDLDWDLDSGNGTYTFDIYRNGVLLVAGLSDTTSHYLDTGLTIATPYTYFVRANGPMGPGFADSSPVTLTTPYNCDGLTPPTVTVTLFNGRPLASYRDQTLYSTHKRRPVLVGTSNIPYATVQIVINTETRMVATVTANMNGYWEWRPTKRLSYERSTMYITATDPLNSTRYAVTSFPYHIVRDEESQDRGDEAKDTASPATTVSSKTYPSKESRDIRVLFDTQDGGSEYMQGETVRTRLTPESIPKGLSERATILRYQLLDQEGESLLTKNSEAFLRVGESIFDEIEVPAFLRPGQYTLLVEWQYQGVQYTQAKDIHVRSIPVIKLSSGRDITYDEFLWNLGWVSFVMLAILLFWLFLVFHEYWLFMRGKLYVDEVNFKKAGYFSRL